MPPQPNGAIGFTGEAAANAMQTGAAIAVAMITTEGA